MLPTAAITLALGIGLSASVSRAVLRGAFGARRDPFHRTPKRGDRLESAYTTRAAPGDTALKVALSLWMGVSGLVAVQQGLWGSLPFVLLFGSGYAWMALGGIRSSIGIANAASLELTEPLVSS